MITTDWTEYGELDDSIYHPIEHTIIIKKSIGCSSSYNFELNKTILGAKDNTETFVVIQGEVNPRKIEKTKEGFIARGYLAAYKKDLEIMLHDKNYAKKFKTKLLKCTAKILNVQNNTPLNIFLSELFDKYQAEVDAEDMYRFKDINTRVSYNIEVPTGLIPPYYIPTTELFRYTNGQLTFTLEEQIKRERRSKELAIPEFRFNEEIDFIFKPIKDEIERRVNGFVKSSEYKRM